VELIARQHEAGIRQQDPHLGNLLVRGDTLYAIDGSTVQAGGSGKPIEPAAGLDSLGRFLAELPPSDDRLVEALCDVYVAARGNANSPSTVARLRHSIQSCRARRIRIILSKTGRECTALAQVRGNGLSAICRRDFASDEMRRILLAPDAAIAAGTMLKNGNSATNVKIVVDGRPVVIKRYNPSRIRKILRDIFLTSRARRAWKNAHLLEALGIAAARPVALIERRTGPFRSTAYVITEFVAGQSGKCLLGRDDLPEPQTREMAESTAELLARLNRAGISHGDLKGANIFYGGSEAVLIDFDAVQQHRFGLLRKRRQLRDHRRLLRNFSVSTPLYRSLVRAIRERLPETGATLDSIRRGALRVWYPLDSSVPARSDALLDCLERSDTPPKSDGNVLKLYRRRSIFHVTNGDLPIVVKAFPLAQIKDKLRWKKYALAEFQNNRRARGLGIRTPECFALFRIRRRGLVDNCGVVMEKLQNCTDLAQLAERDTQQFLRAVPVFAGLYAAGVDHLDVTPSNVFFDNRTGDWVIIDWQYCRFHAPRNDVQLTMQAAHFLNFAGVTRENELWGRWIADLHRQSRTGMPLTALESAIDALQQNKLRVCDRLKAPERIFAAA
jgi:tRNA A-37 threonylcarbamoyl transferase component Bud32